ncbi:MAG: hypothetical protein ACI4EX_07125 [Lachnospiraceae bacterium]
MADLRNIMLEEIRKSAMLQTSLVDVTEELIDTGLEKNEVNIRAVAMSYLDERGYRRIAENVELAKQIIMEESKNYDTIIVKKNRVEETDLFEDASNEELRDALNVCMYETLSSIHTKLDRLVNKQYEYKIEVVDALHVDSDRPKGRLMDDFETFEEIMTRMSNKGWELDQVIKEDKMGTIPARRFIVFKREKMS